MNIAIDVRSLSYSRTGIPGYVHELLRYICEYDKINQYFLYSTVPIKIDFELADNVHHYMIPRRPELLWIYTVVPGLLKRDKIDVFFSPCYFLPRRIKGIKYVVTVCDLFYIWYPQCGTLRNVLEHLLLLKGSIKRADKIIAISESTKNDICRYMKWKPDNKKVEVVYIGESVYDRNISSVSEEDRQKFEKKWDVTDYFLFVSTIEPKKNVGTLISAYNYYRKNNYGNEKLYIVGGWGWKSDDVKQKLEDSPFRDDIILTGYVTDVEKELFYRGATALVHPAYFEGFGMTVLEAMSLGIPVITTKETSLPEVGGDVPFYMKNPFDEKELAELMSKVSGLTAEEREIVAEKGVKRSRIFNRAEQGRQTLRVLVES